MNKIKLMSMSLLCTTAISLYASQPPEEQAPHASTRTMESTLETIKTLYSQLDTETRRLGAWTKIPAAITSSLALFAAIRRILPDKNDYVIPTLGAAAAAYFSYNWAPTIASWLLTKKPLMHTVTPIVAPPNCLQNISTFNNLLKTEQQALINLNVPHHQLLDQADILNGTPRQLLIHCLHHKAIESAPTGGSSHSSTSTTTLD